MVETGLGIAFKGRLVEEEVYDFVCVVVRLVMAFWKRQESRWRGG